MSVYAISDLHLSFSSEKPMDVFHGWSNYVERIESNWKRIVKPNDTVVLPGDFSWALKLEDTLKDFEFLNSLPGKKILLKGNHDLWWSTANKINIFLKENSFDTIQILFNSAVLTDGVAICGTRGWMYDEGAENKIRKREVGRLVRSLEMAKSLNAPPVLFLHYPPAYADYVCEDFFDVFKQYGITKVYHGHIHGSGFNNAVSSYNGVSLKLISADCIDFCPVFVK